MKLQCWCSYIGDPQNQIRIQCPKCKRTYHRLNDGGYGEYFGNFDGEVSRQTSNVKVNINYSPVDLNGEIAGAAIGGLVAGPVGAVAGFLLGRWL